MEIVKKEGEKTLASTNEIWGEKTNSYLIIGQPLTTPLQDDRLLCSLSS